MKKRDILLLENGTKNIALRRKFNQNLIEAGGIPKYHEEYTDFDFGIEIETCFNSQYEKLMHDFGIASDFQEYHDDSGGWKEYEDDERYQSFDDRKIQARASMKELTHLYGLEKAEKMQGEIYNVLDKFILTEDSSIECGDSIVPPHKLPFQNCHHISQHNIHRYQYDEDPTNIFRTIDNLDDPRLNKYVPIEFVSTHLFQYPLSGTFKEAIAFIQQHSQLCVEKNYDDVKNAKRRLKDANVQAKMHTEQAYSLRKKRKVPQNIKKDITNARKTLREGKLSKYKGSCGTHVHVSKRTTLTTDMTFLTTLNDFWVRKYQQRFMDKFYRAQDRDDNIYYARMNCGTNHDIFYDDVNKSVYGEDFQRLFSGRYRLLNLTPTFTDWENSWKNANGGDDAISMKQQHQHREKDVRPIHVEFRGLGELIDNTGKTRTLSIAAKQSIGHRLEEYMVHIMNFWLETEKVHSRSLNIYKTKPFRYFYDRLSTDFLNYLQDIPVEKNFHLLLSLPFGLQKNKPRIYFRTRHDKIIKYRRGGKYVACFQIYLVFSKNRWGRFRKVLQDFNVSSTDTNPGVFDSEYGEDCQDMIHGVIFKKVTKVRSRKTYYPTPQDKINYENMLYKDLALFPYQYSEMVRMFDHGYEDMIKNIRNTYAFHPKYKDNDRYVHSYYNITDGKNHAKIEHGATAMGIYGGDEGQKDVLNERYRIQNQIH